MAWFSAFRKWAIRAMDGTYFENKELKPDIEVYNTPSDYETGNDEQLKAAVESLK